MKTLYTFLSKNPRYLLWRLRRPFASYADYYVQHVAARLESGASHITLGKSRKDAEVFERTGAAILRFLKQQGLEPHHLCVDYGCGSLRVGRHLMRYLQPGHYWGFDITDRFFNDGLDDLSPALIEKQQPNLRVISKDSIAEFATRKPDYIISSGVLLHVPVPDLDRFFRHVFQLLGPNTVAFIHFREGKTLEQTGKLTWAYPGEFLRERIDRHGIHVALMRTNSTEGAAIRPLEPGEYRPMYLKITRQAASPLPGGSPTSATA